VDGAGSLDRVPLSRVVEDVTVALRDATTVDDACRRTVDAVARHTEGMIAALLRVRDHLRCVAAAGAWSVFSSVPTDAGVVGRVFRSGQTVVLPDATQDGDYVSLATTAAAEICAPLLGSGGRPIGALNLEWTRSGLDIHGWHAAVETVAARLGERITDLGGPPAESTDEQLLRHALLMTSAGDERDLLHRSLSAVREVSGMSTAILVLPGRRGARVVPDPEVPTPLGSRLRSLDRTILTRITLRARRHGASYTLGDPRQLDAGGFEALTTAGVRSMITVPVGPPTPSSGGVLLVVDDAVGYPNPATVNLLELLAAQAWTSLDRIRTLQQLHERAISDPLTGLRHHGPFGERLAGTVPGRTALLSIDVDRFKSINDTYGHEAGDRALVDLARTLQGALRARDELYRVGGDEFAAVIEVQRPEEAAGVAHRLVNAARGVGHPISVGVAVQAEGEAAKQTLRRADMALYEVKQAGRDGVRVAAAHPAPADARLTPPRVPTSGEGTDVA
jgi:diguanylate cyclase (GGDEF)-like protein